MSVSVEKVIQALRGLTTEPGKKRKNRKKKSSSTPGTSGSTVVQPLVVGASKKKKRSRKGGGGTVSGEVHVNRMELLTELKTDTSGVVQGSIVLTPLNFPWLSNLAKAFERVRWRACSLEYRPSVGANTDGTVAIGLDWGTASAKSAVLEKDGFELLTVGDKVSRVEVLACTPSVDGPVWQRVPNLVVPASRLQSRAWYEVPASTSDSIPVYDQAPGQVVYHAQAAASKTVGEVWVRYAVTLSGTRKV